MTLSQDQLNEISDVLASKGANNTCGECGRAESSMLEGVFALAGNGPPVPLIAVVCGNCGNMKLFSLATLGVLKDPQEP